MYNVVSVWLQLTSGVLRFPCDFVFPRAVDVFPMTCSGANARARARAAAPQPRRARATRGREELAVAPRLDQPTLARLVKVGASISEPIVDHREQIRLFAAADDRARRRHHSRTRQCSV